MSDTNAVISLPPAIACGYGVEAIEDIVDYFRKQFTIISDDFLQAVLQVLNCTIEDDSDSRKPEIHGTLEVHGPMQWTVYLPNHTGPLQDRFTLAHELGHYVLHSKFGQTPLVASRTFSSNDTPDVAEVEADAFALAFLMPKDKFIEAVNKYGVNTEILSAEFKVDLSAAKIRLRSLGLHRDN